MPAYSFQKQFVPKVESGEKTHTIRGKRKARPRPGQRFYGYYGMRTKQCRKLIESVITKVGDIWIVDSGRKFAGFSEVVNGQHLFGIYPQIEIDGCKLADDEMETLAIRDGFAGLWDMSGFWDLNQRFNGDIIHWRPPQQLTDGSDNADISPPHNGGATHGKVTADLSRLPQAKRNGFENSTLRVPDVELSALCSDVRHGAAARTTDFLPGIEPEPTAHDFSETEQP